MIDNLQQALIRRALSHAGGVWCPVYRPMLDENGSSTGEETRIACIFGKSYTHGNSQTLHIDIPGILLRTDVLRFEGIAACGCSVIQAHDEICVRGTRLRILRVDVIADGVYVLTLEE